jgi:hypothetical protein
MRFPAYQDRPGVRRVPARISLVAVRLQYVIGPRYRVRQVGQEEQVVVKGLYDIVSDKVVRVNLLMSQMVVTFPVVIHFTQPLQAFLAGLRPRPAGRERAASKAGASRLTRP